MGRICFSRGKSVAVLSFGNILASIHRCCLYAPYYRKTTRLNRITRTATKTPSHARPISQPLYWIIKQCELSDIKTCLFVTGKWRLLTIALIWMYCMHWLSHDWQQRSYCYPVSPHIFHTAMSMNVTFRFTAPGTLARFLTFNHRTLAYAFGFVVFWTQNNIISVDDLFANITKRFGFLFSELYS